MKLAFDLLLDLWYIWVLLIISAILSLLRPKIKGALGEKSVSFFLARLDPKKYKVLNNLLIKVGSKTVQIDHVVVSNYGIFVIETKNYQGWIYGNEFDEYWTQVIYKRKEKFYNPIRQNYGHIQALKEILKEFENLKFISIIVFTTKAELKVKVKTDVIYTVKLLRTIKKYNQECLTDEQRDAIYEKLKSANISDRRNMREHVRSVRANKKKKTIKL
ncbi:NERD domain protein [Caldicellulosiruptor kronotskyensis 2002]|uniref:NERD domain protein n=1 Tax=Caldicellulosiruptor kronotskyensis (strain DSM 18902 / VKM B-2412 / 2002) TaxID=632348 RepID=E4SCW8_CALK2|nr:nuclease-related domain-containing protein [Caldicellulosiruptor kronotskyensis]ADQ45984.1 NERD domain protein [Caldicellulosiruptor kronotskyensis 2002]